MAATADEEAIRALKKLEALGVDLDEVQALLSEMYGESYVAGAWVAAGLVDEAGGEAVRPAWLAAVDWDRWQPGNNAAAAELAGADGGRGLAAMLDEAEVVIKGVRGTLLDKLGKSLGEGMAEGESVDTLADRVSELLGDESRGDAIARTESARAQSVSAMDTFAENGVSGKQWLVFDPCPICADNEADGVIALDDVFASGDTEPPAHPNCECAVAPVVDTGE